jgi:dihydrodipicolinate synthase/N-acetylneuraminate lyase
MTLQFNQPLLLGATSVFLMQSPHCQPVQEYWDLARAGKAAEASKKYYELQPLRDVWKGIYESLWNKKGATHPLPYIKYWMELNGMSAGPVRPPMHNIGEREKTEFRERLEGSGWLERIAPKQAKRAAA